jgi:predicted  nucleic acid-binding Zn-ribbon protein
MIKKEEFISAFGNDVAALIDATEGTAELAHVTSAAVGLTAARCLFQLAEGQEAIVNQLSRAGQLFNGIGQCFDSIESDVEDAFKLVEDDMQNMAEDLANAETAINEHTLDIIKLEDEVTELRAQVTSDGSVRKQTARLAQRVEQLEEEIAKDDDEVAKDLSNLDKDVEALRSENAKLRQQVAEQGQWVSEIHARQVKMQADIKDGFAKALAALLEDRNNLINLTGALNTAFGEVAKDMGEAQANVDDLEEYYDDELATMEAQIGDLFGAIADIKLALPKKRVDLNSVVTIEIQPTEGSMEALGELLGNTRPRVLVTPAPKEPKLLKADFGQPVILGVDRGAESYSVAQVVVPKLAVPGINKVVSEQEARDHMIIDPKVRYEHQNGLEYRGVGGQVEFFNRCNHTWQPSCMNSAQHALDCYTPEYRRVA